MPLPLDDEQGVFPLGCLLLALTFALGVYAGLNWSL